MDGMSQVFHFPTNTLICCPHTAFSNLHAYKSKQNKLIMQLRSVTLYYYTAYNKVFDNSFIILISKFSFKNNFGTT